MVQLNSFRVGHYRGIDGLSLSRLSKANLITGANGVGKTALIEAIWLFAGRYNPSLLWNINLQRTPVDLADPISRLTGGDLELYAVENGEQHSLKFRFEKIDGRSPTERIAGTVQEDLKSLPPAVGFVRIYLDGKLVKGRPESMHVMPSGSVLYASPTVPAGRNDCIFLSTRSQYDTPKELVSRYSDLVREGRKKELVRAISVVTPNVDEVEILTDVGGVSYLSVTTSGEHPRPLHDLGGGAVSLVRLLIGFFSAQGRILLSDELENGFHHSAQREIWERARQWIKQWNVQLVATTHSAEFIEAAIDAFSDRPEELAIHKLYRNEKTGLPEVGTFTGDSLVGARSLDLEVR